MDKFNGIGRGYSDLRGTPIIGEERNLMTRKHDKGSFLC